MATFDELDATTRTELEAAAFRRLLKHLDDNKDVQNIDLMILADFCRNCLSKWTPPASTSTACPTASGKPITRVRQRRNSWLLLKRAKPRKRPTPPPTSTRSSAMDAMEALNIAVLTVSDTRTEETDRSGQSLVQRLTEAGHRLADKRIVPDDVYQIRAVVAQWIADPGVQVVLTTGGTGFTGRDSTPEAVSVLLDKRIEGFGERFRQLSGDEIGSSTIQSRALGGFANATVVFCLPGSTGACRTGWDGILAEQLDSRHKPCNFANLVIPGRGQHG